MLGRTTDRYRAASLTDGEIGQLLPETRHLLEAVEAAECMYELDRSDLEERNQIASYRVHPQGNLPLLKFYVVGGNEYLLALAGKELPGFEVLQVFFAGLQYHWRSDLVRVLEEQVPLISRLYGITGQRDFVLEHLAVPVPKNNRVHEIWGWFTSDQDFNRIVETVRLSKVTMFRRSESAQTVRLHKGAVRQN